MVRMVMRMGVPVVSACAAAGVGCGIGVAVVAVYHMRGYKLMQQPGYCLNPKKSTNETPHHDKACGLLRPPIVFEVFFRFG